MTPTLPDHLFVIVVIGVVFPFFGWWAYRRFLERVKREGGAAGLSAIPHRWRRRLAWADRIETAGLRLLGRRSFGGRRRQPLSPTKSRLEAGDAARRR